MADAVEAAWQHMQEKAADELVRGSASSLSQPRAEPSTEGTRVTKEQVRRRRRPGPREAPLLAKCRRKTGKNAPRAAQ